MPDRTPEEWNKIFTETFNSQRIVSGIAKFATMVRNEARREAFEEAIKECETYFTIEGIAEKCASAIREELLLRVESGLDTNK